MAWASKAAQTNVANAGNQIDASKVLGSQFQGQNAQFQGNAAQQYGVLSPEVSSLLNSPGFDPATLSAITNSTMGAAVTPFDTASTEANNQTARTRNSAGIAESQDQLAIDKSKAASGAANQVTMENAAQKNLEQERGLQLGQSLYGTNVSGQTSTGNQQLGALNAGTAAVGAQDQAIQGQNAASGPSWLQALTGIGGMVLPKPGGK